MREEGALEARPLLAALGDGGVGFIVIGGLAVGAHGFPRATKDIDIVPDPSPENLERLARVLAELDYAIIGVEDLEPAELVQPDLEGLRGGGSWVLRTRFGRLDILQHVEPDLIYEALDQNAIEDEVFGSRVRFCGYEDLIAMKRAAGRSQDLVDIERLDIVRGEE